MLHYLSADEMYRCQMASRYGAQLHQHPVELSAVPSHGTLIIDYDHILFDSKAEAVAAAQRWLTAGGVFGMHTYHPDDPQLAVLARHPHAVLAKTLQQVVRALRGLPQRDAQRVAA